MATGGGVQSLVFVDQPSGSRLRTSFSGPHLVTFGITTTDRYR